MGSTLMKESPPHSPRPSQEKKLQASASPSHGVAPAAKFTEFGGPVPYHPTEDLAYSVAKFIMKGGSFINYYMANDAEKALHEFQESSRKTAIQQ
nr:beta-galactosidase-like [Ipomoea trifida]